MNWFKQAKVLMGKDENVLELVFQASSTTTTRISVAALSVMLATRGWKTSELFNGTHHS
jgi:hypothetical protein